MNKAKSTTISTGIIAIATAFMIFAIWNENISMATRPFIALAYLVLMMAAIFLKKILRNR